MVKRIFIFFILGLAITGIPLGFQIFLLNEQLSELIFEIEFKNEEISKINSELVNSFDKFISKCDLYLISEIFKTMKGNVNKYFAVTIEFLDEIFEDDTRKLNSIGIGFVSINNSLVHKGEKYLALGSRWAIYQVLRRDDVTRIEYGFSRNVIDFTVGPYQEDAFANISKYADVTISSETMSLGNWIEITVKNTHPTKKLAFTLIIYYEIKDGLQVEVFSTALSPPKDMFDYPPYIFLNSGSECNIQFRPEMPGDYFITPNHVEFVVLTK
ncbi:MAG: hypothetical protein ACFFDT_18380 [Candidatus Hodarchaeota archaeon]